MFMYLAHTLVSHESRVVKVSKENRKMRYYEPAIDFGEIIYVVKSRIVSHYKVVMLHLPVK